MPDRVQEAMENAEKIKVLVVDDHPLMRVGIAAIINARADMITVAQAGEAKKLWSCSSSTGQT